MDAIRKACTPLIGTSIEYFESAEYRSSYYDGEEWWDGDPMEAIVLHCTDNNVLSISWADFDRLRVSNDDDSLDDDDPDVCWKRNGIEAIGAVVGCGPVRGAYLGRGQMTLTPQHSVEIWTSVYLDLSEDRWLEVYNTLDENGYCFHYGKPKGVELIKCTLE